jgi:predicted ATPase
VAQVAACLGREFSYELLAAVAPLDAATLQDALHELTQAELVFGEGKPPDAKYLFKHALVRDAAYESLLKGRRQALHARIAAALEKRFLDIARAQPELVAHHCTAAGLTEKAVEYWSKAGQSAIERSAMAEAVVQLKKGLELLAGLPDDATRRRRELDLQVDLGVALMAARGWGSPEAGGAYARARELCEQIGTVAQLWPVLFGQWVFHSVRADRNPAREVTEELLRRAQENGDTDAIMVAHRTVGTDAFLCGEVVAARAHLEQALALYNPERHRSFALRYVYDPRVAALSWLAFALASLGYPKQAKDRSREALAAGSELGHLTTLANARMYACFLAQLCREDRTARDQAEALAALATEQKFPHFVAAATALRGWARAEAGEVEAGLAHLRQGFAEWREMGGRHWEPYFLGLQAETQGRVGQVSEALVLVKQALEEAERTVGGWFEAELHRLHGEALLRTEQPNMREAEACFRLALSVAQKQSAKWWELRAARSLARIWADRGERRKAHDLLAPVYGWFTEGFETADLKDARWLLGELR